jgi:hypothetical protein
MDGYLSEAESKEKHGVFDPMPELTLTSPYVQSRVDSPTHLPSATLRQSRQNTLGVFSKYVYTL